MNLKSVASLIVGLGIGTVTGCAVTDSSADTQQLPLGNVVYGTTVQIGGHEIPCVVAQRGGFVALSCNWNGLTVL
jgi:hypothetical protein